MPKPDKSGNIHTDVTVRRDDYIHLKELHEIAKSTNNKADWDLMHGAVNELATGKYGLPERTGGYGLSVKGEFLFKEDSVIKVRTEEPLPKPDGYDDMLDEASRHVDGRPK